MSKFMVGVLGLQGDIEEHLAASRHAIAEAGLNGEVRVVKSPSDVETIDGLIISGGESTVIAKLATFNKVSETISSRLKQGMPVLGTCAGLIYLSRKVYDRTVGETDQPLLGVLDVMVERNSFGRQRQSFEANLDIPKLGEKPFRGVFIRAPSIRQAGREVEIISKLNDVIVAVQEGNVIGTAFHPELSGDSRLHKFFIEMVGSYSSPRITR